MVYLGRQLGIELDTIQAGYVKSLWILKKAKKAKNNTVKW